MIPLTLAWSAFFSFQDPDRSTPEKALESFVAFWDQSRLEVDCWRKVEKEADALTDSYRTGELREKKAAKREEARKYADDFRLVPGRVDIQECTGGDQSRLLTVSCAMCAGKAKCAQCAGNGKRRICNGSGALEGYSCISCSGGGTCGTCRGSGGCGSCRGFGWVAGE